MKNLLFLVEALLLSTASLLVFTNSTHGSPSPLSKTTISQTQGGSLELGLDQFVTDNSISDTIGFYRDTIQLVNYEGRPLVGLTFDLISNGKVIMTPVTYDTSFSADSWIITTTIHRGPQLADGSSLDTIRAVLFSTGSAAIYPTAKTVIASFGYYTIDIDTVSDTTSIQLQNINGAAVDSLGWPIEAGLNTNDYQRITIIDLTTINVSFGVGWNLVSVPLVPSTFDANALFPGKSGTMFAFNTASQSYIAAPLLANGQGYWVKYTSAGNNAISGTVVSGTTVAVEQAGWVLLGSMSSTVAINTLSTAPAGAITGAVWRFNPLTQGYVAATVINPGEAVWVKVSQACTITFP